MKSKSDKRIPKRQVIATRNYVIEGTEPLQRITVSIARPRQIRAGEDFICPTEMVGWGATRVRQIRGKDAFEALQLAFIIIGVELKYLDEQSNGGLRSTDGTRADIGFPVYPDYSLSHLMREDKSEAVSPAKSNET